MSTELTGTSSPLHGILSGAATAVGEYGSGRPDRAEAVWLEAWWAADRLFARGSEQHAAAWEIMSVIRAGMEPALGAPLRKALDAAAAAVLPAMDGDREALAARLRDAEEAASPLPAEMRDAFACVHAEIRRMAESGVAS
jgi:hypothetical protein